jgi:hypothetical protein
MSFEKCEHKNLFWANELDICFCADCGVDYMSRHTQHTYPTEQEINEGTLRSLITNGYEPTELDMLILGGI